MKSRHDRSALTSTYVNSAKTRLGFCNIQGFVST